MNRINKYAICVIILFVADGYVSAGDGAIWVHADKLEPIICLGEPHYVNLSIIGHRTAKKQHEAFVHMLQEEQGALIVEDRGSGNLIPACFPQWWADGTISSRARALARKIRKQGNNFYYGDSLGAPREGIQVASLLLTLGLYIDQFPVFNVEFRHILENTREFSLDKRRAVLQTVITNIVSIHGQRVYRDLVDNAQKILNWSDSDFDAFHSQEARALAAFPTHMLTQQVRLSAEVQDAIYTARKVYDVYNQLIPAYITYAATYISGWTEGEKPLFIAAGINHILDFEKTYLIPAGYTCVYQRGAHTRPLIDQVRNATTQEEMRRLINDLSYNVLDIARDIHTPLQKIRQERRKAAKIKSLSLKTHTLISLASNLSVAVAAGWATSFLLKKCMAFGN